MSIEERYAYELDKLKPKFARLYKQVEERYRLKAKRLWLKGLISEKDWLHYMETEKELLRDFVNLQLQAEALKKAINFAMRLITDLESKIPKEGGESSE